MIRLVRLGAVLLCAAILVQDAAAQSRGQRKKEAAPQGPSGDRRDQMVAAPGTAYHGKPYWLGMAQCGGAYFKLGNLYAEEATRTRQAKPDPAAAAAFTKQSESAGRAAATFFELAERFLMTDRGLSQDDAVQAFDGQAASTGDRLKSVDAAVKAVEPCPALHETCRASVAKICSEKSVLTH